MDFKQDFKALYGTLEQMSPLIVRVLCQNPSPYTYTGTGTYIVGNGPSVAVIDPGPYDLKHGAALLSALSGKTVSHILVTHSHQDHSPLAAWFAEKTGAPVYAYGPHGAGRKAGLEEEEVEAGADKSFQPSHRLKDGEVLHGEGWTIEAIHTPGHTANHMCFHLKEENTIFVGDHVMAWATSVISPPDGDMRDYLESLRKIGDRKADILVPTHGPWVKNPAPFIRGIITHRKMREGQILSQIEKGHTTIEAMVSHMYKEVDPRLHGAAARSVLGHLVALVDEKRVLCNGPLGLSGNYSLPE